MDLESLSRSMEQARSWSCLDEQIASASRLTKLADSTSSVPHWLDSSSFACERVAAVSSKLEQIDSFSRMAERVRSASSNLEQLEPTSKMAGAMNASYRMIEEIARPWGETLERINSFSRSAEQICNPLGQILERLDLCSIETGRMTTLSNIAKRLETLPGVTEQIESLSRVADKMGKLSDVAGRLSAPLTEAIKRMDSFPDVVGWTNQQHSMVGQIKETAEMLAQLSSGGAHNEGATSHGVDESEDADEPEPEVDEAAIEASVSDLLSTMNATSETGSEPFVTATDAQDISRSFSALLCTLLPANVVRDSYEPACNDRFVERVEACTQQGFPISKATLSEQEKCQLLLLAIVSFLWSIMIKSASKTLGRPS